MRRTRSQLKEAEVCTCRRITTEYQPANKSKKVTKKDTPKRVEEEEEVEEEEVDTKKTASKYDMTE